MTLAEILVGIVLVIILFVLFIPALSRASRQDKIQACAGNLGLLHKARQSASLPFHPGSKYWTDLPGVDASALHCPLRDPHEPLPVDYWGPSEDPSGRSEDEPIGCDAPDNHSHSGREGSNILLKSGRVVLDNRHGPDSLFGAAVRMGRCIP